MSQSVKYPALRTVQVQGGSPLILFSAPALEIDEWAGVPQKKGGSDQEETVGFQRDEDNSRVASLAAFLREANNIVQNPLLCARRETSFGTVSFKPDDNDADLDAPHTLAGVLEIEIEDLDELPMVELLKGVMSQIESRLPDLDNHEADPSKVAEIVKRLREQSEIDPDEQDQESDDDGDEDAMTALFTDETHVVDFWQELAARAEAINQLANFNGSEVAGFTREALVSFLKPAIVVDGQHRLRGAVRAARDRMLNDTSIQEISEELINNGEEESKVQAEVERLADRYIPVSLVWSDQPAEHVFQFVVVNQKATPIHKALLGTILSTTLTREETEQVRERLEGAGIRLQQAQSVAYMSRNPESPFCGKVETGLAGESGNKLAWSVMESLIRIFQDLKGGKLYHQTGQSLDNAENWKVKRLSKSAIIDDWEDQGYDSEYEYWRAPDGPWRQVFLSFYSKIRDYFANTTDCDASNYWGDPKVSNLFNKVSLTILSADFFQFLYEKEKLIDSPDAINDLVDDWLEDVSNDYFTGDWPLQNKKDAPGTRKRWASNWESYRKSPVKRLPSKKSFGQPL